MAKYHVALGDIWPWNALNLVPLIQQIKHMFKGQVTKGPVSMLGVKDVHPKNTEVGTVIPLLQGPRSYHPVNEAVPSAAVIFPPRRLVRLPGVSHGPAVRIQKLEPFPADKG